MDEMKDRTIYDLGLNESLLISDHIIVRRVPGGWIYEDVYETSDFAALSSVFVPWDNEFQVKEDN